MAKNVDLQGILDAIQVQKKEDEIHEKAMKEMRKLRDDFHNKQQLAGSMILLGAEGICITYHYLTSLFSLSDLSVEPINGSDNVKVYTMIDDTKVYAYASKEYVQGGTSNEH